MVLASNPRIFAGLPNNFFLHVAQISDTTESVPQWRTLRKAVITNRAAVLLPTHQFVETDCHRKSHQDHSTRLGVDGSATKPEHQPYKNNDKVHRKDGKGRAKMREPHVDEQVVQVRLVRLERRPSSQHSCSHHPQGVKNRYA